MIKFENTNEQKCYICDEEDKHLQKINIMKNSEKGNDISFVVCDSCLCEFMIDIDEQLIFLEECENYQY